MGICAGEAINVESIDVEGLGRPSWGVGCGDMCRRGYRRRIKRRPAAGEENFLDICRQGYKRRIYRRRGLGKAVLGSGLFFFLITLHADVGESTVLMSKAASTVTN